MSGPLRCLECGIADEDVYIEPDGIRAGIAHHGGDKYCLATALALLAETAPILRYMATCPIISQHYRDLAKAIRARMPQEGE